MDTSSCKDLKTYIEEAKKISFICGRTEPRCVTCVNNVDCVMIKNNINDISCLYECEPDKDCPTICPRNIKKSN